MKYDQLSKARLCVPSSGGDLTILSETGEPVAMIGLSPGVCRGAQFLDLLMPGQAVALSEGVTALAPGGKRLASQRFGALAHATGANPDFQPSSASVEEMRLRRLLKDVAAQSNALERRSRQFDRMAKAKADPAPVIEDAPAVPVKQVQQADTGADAVEK